MMIISYGNEKREVICHDFPFFLQQLAVVMFS